MSPEPSARKRKRTEAGTSQRSTKRIAADSSSETESETEFSSDESSLQYIDVPSTSTPSTPDFLSEYTCPICFSPPTNATLTPCGHICCGPCLFTAVKTTLQRGAVGLGREPNVARCPVCRAPIPGWDGRGGGVIGLKTRVVISL